MGQIMVATIGPLAALDADGVSLSQTATAAQYLVINGALAAGTFSATSVCAAQTAAGAQNLTINGTLATTNPVAGAGGSAAAGSATVRFPSPSRVYVTTAGNSSTRTITIVGTLQSPGTFGPGVVVSETFTAPNTNVRASTNLYSTIISVAISGASTGNVSVGHSGTATMDQAREVTITSGGDDTGITFTLSGYDVNNDPISEVITGVSGAAATSVLSYSSVTSILTSGAAATTLTVGSSDSASRTYRFDDFAGNAQVAIQVDGSGTVNWSVSQSMNDPNTITNQLPTPTYRYTPATVNWVPHPDTALVGSTVITGVQGNYAYTPVLARLKLNSGTGSITGTMRQVFTS